MFQNELEPFTNPPEKNTTGAEDWTEVYEAVRWIQFVMASLSVLGSVSIIVCVLKQRLSRTPELQPLFLLSVSDLLLSVCWLIGASLFSRHCNCYHLHTIEQTLYMASFCYTLNYVWNLFTAVTHKLNYCVSGYPGQFSNRVSTAGKITALLSGVLPVLLMTPVFIQGNISQCQTNFSEPYRCLLMQTGALYVTSHHPQPIGICGILHAYRIIVFLSTFLCTLLGIIVLMSKARGVYRRVVTSHGYLGNHQRVCVRVLERRMVLYPLVFVLCWGPAFGLALVRIVKPSAGQGAAGVCLYIAQAFTSASQGFLNCLVFGWTRSHVQLVGRRLLSRDTHTHSDTHTRSHTHSDTHTRTDSHTQTQPLLSAWEKPQKKKIIYQNYQSLRNI